MAGKKRYKQAWTVGVIVALCFHCCAAINELVCANKDKFACSVTVTPPGNISHCVVSQDCKRAASVFRRLPNAWDHASLRGINGSRTDRVYRLSFSWLPPVLGEVAAKVSAFLLTFRNRQSNLSRCYFVEVQGEMTSDQIFSSNCFPVEKQSKHILDLTILPQGTTTRYYATVPDNIDESHSARLWKPVIVRRVAYATKELTIYINPAPPKFGFQWYEMYLVRLPDYYKAGQNRVPANAWKPSMARRVNYKRREVTIYIQPAPKRYQFNNFELILFKKDIDMQHGCYDLPTQTTTLNFTFKGVSQGRYFLRVTPESCGGPGPDHECFPTDTDLFRMFGPDNPEFPIVVPPSPPSTALRPDSTPAAATTAAESVEKTGDSSSVVAAVVGTVGGFGLLLVAILVYLRHKSRPESFDVMSPSLHSHQNGLATTNHVIVDTTPKVLLLYADDMTEVGGCFADYLRLEWQCDVYCEKELPKGSSSELWVKTSFNESNFVVFLCSSRSRVLLQESKACGQCSMFVLGVCRVRREMAELTMPKKIVSVYFDTHSLSDIPYQLDKPGIKKYCLMRDMADLYSHFHGTTAINNVHLRPTTYMLSPSGKRLYSALEMLKSAGYTNSHSGLAKSDGHELLPLVVPPSPPRSYATDDVMRTMRSWNEEDDDKCLQWVSQINGHSPLSDCIERHNSNDDFAEHYSDSGHGLFHPDYNPSYHLPLDSKSCDPVAPTDHFQSLIIKDPASQSIYANSDQHPNDASLHSCHHVLPGDDRKPSAENAHHQFCTAFNNSAFGTELALDDLSEHQELLAPDEKRQFSCNDDGYFSKTSEGGAEVMMLLQQKVPIESSE